MTRSRDYHVDEYQYQHQTRRYVLERDGYICQECGAPYDDGQGLCVHHIIPRSRGGTDNLNNLVTVCEQCHIAIHQPDSWNYFMRVRALRNIERRREKLADLYNCFIAALYGQDGLPCDLWEGELIVFYPEEETYGSKI